MQKGAGGSLVREDYDAFTWSMVCLYGDVVSDMGPIHPWSKSALHKQDAREVEALRHLKGVFARLRKQS